MEVRKLKQQQKQELKWELSGEKKRIHICQ